MAVFIRYFLGATIGIYRQFLKTGNSLLTVPFISYIISKITVPKAGIS